MEIVVRGKHFDVPERVEERARRKLARLDHYLPMLHDAKVEVDIAEERTKEPDGRFVVHVSVSGSGVHLRAEERAAKLEMAVDRAARVLGVQASRYKERLYDRGRSPAAKDGPLPPATAAAESPSETGARRKLAGVSRVRVKPMTVEEALEQIELLGHEFLLFLDADRDQFALLHRRPDGGYGLIEPELA